REKLYERINKRVDLMMKQGLLEEVKSLYNSGLDREAQSIKAIGYNELFGYLDGHYSLEEAVELLKKNSRNFAKRQLTWFRNKIYERINKRVDLMMKQGLLEEVKSLYNSGLDREAQSIKAIGYNELFGYLDGHYSLEEAVELLKKNSRNFAKRQLTWFRNK